MTLTTDNPRYARGPVGLEPPRRAPGAPEILERSAGRGSGVVVGLTLVALTLTSAAGFHRVFTDRAWVIPVVVTALAAHGLSALLRRTNLPPVLAMAAGLAGVGLLGVATVLGWSGFHGFPATTWRILADDVGQARAEFPTVVAPVPTAPGFDLLAAWGVGLVAVLGDWGTFRLRSAAQGAGPGLALFVVCSLLGSPIGRAATVSAWLGAAIVYLLAHQIAANHRGARWFAGRTAHSLGPTVAAGIAIGGAALLVAVAVTPALANRDGHGALGWSHGPGAAGTRVVESPIVDLRTRIVQESDVPVFTVRSPVPDYWRLTSLDYFNGTLWESTDSYEPVHDRLPGLSPTSAGMRRVVEDFHVQNLDSIWLPMAFDPEAVVGAGAVTYDPTSASLLTSHATSDDLDYQVTSVETLDTLDAAKLAAAGPLPRKAALSRYLELPSGIPAAVVALAKNITAGDHTEYAKALALQDYLLGPLFTYSTDPPTDGYGTSALATFLLDTRTGYCQQFAGSYAVMARIVGLPTRLAVGFATGVPDGNGVYHVTNADAHTWPEVYFPRYGWVPFEPTKGNFAIPGGDAYTGSKTGDYSNPGYAPLPSGSPAPNAPVKAAPRSAPARATTLTTGAHGHRDRGQEVEVPLLFALVVLGVALLAWPGVNLLARRRRWARRRRRAGERGGARVLVAWQELGESLAWWGVARRVDETPGEYARRAAAHLAAVLDRGGRMPAAGATPVRPVADVNVPELNVPDWNGYSRALVELARDVNRARFADGDVPGAVADIAVATAAGVAGTLHDGAPLRSRLRWWLDPRLAWVAPGPTEAG